MEELKLIEQAKRGDKEAFVSLYGIHKDAMYRYSYYRLGNPEDAEDAVSECVLSVWKQIGSLQKVEAFKGWLYRILSATCARRIKEQIHAREGTEALQHEWKEAEDPQTHSVELMQALAQLAYDEKEVILLTVVSGLNSKEAGRICGMTPGGIRSKQSRALKKMREYLENEK